MMSQRPERQPNMAMTLAQLAAYWLSWFTSLKPTPTPAPAPIDPATYAVDWSKIDRNPVGRFLRYVTNTDPNDFILLLKRWQSACDNVVAVGGSRILIWDLATTDYDADWRKSNIPIVTMQAMHDYAKTKGLKWGILIPNYFQDNQGDAYTASCIEISQYHHDNWGMTEFYLDANYGQDVMRVRKIVVALTDCTFDVENYQPRDGIKYNQTDFGKVASLWYGLDQANRPLPDADFTGGLWLYTSHWGQLSATDKAALVAWCKLHPMQWAAIWDCFAGGDPIPAELK